MASISLPTPGQKPWDLNAPITAINTQLDSVASDVSTRLSDEALNDKIVAEVAPATAPAMALAEAGPLMRKLELNQGNAVIAVVGDSTGQGNTTTSKRWPLRFAEKLAAAFPAYTVVFRLWNSTSVDYDAAVTIQAGTGANTLTVYSGSASGMGTDYSINNLPTLLPVEPDVTIVSHGHNETAAYFSAARTGLVRLARAIQKRFPATALVAVAQNPRKTADASYADQLASRVAAAKMSAREGYGFIDIATAFRNYPSWETALMAANPDMTHPNDAGYELWASEVFARFAASPRAGSRVMRPTGDRLYYGADRFIRSFGTPEMVYHTNGSARSGWAMDATTREAVTAVVDIPESWKAFDFYQFWTTLSNPGGLGPGVVSWGLATGGARSTIGDTAATVYPVETAPTFTSFATGTQVSETISSSSALGALRRRSALAGTSNAYPASVRGVHELQVARAGDSGTDTFPVDAVFLGVLFERVE